MIKRRKYTSLSGRGSEDGSAAFDCGAASVAEPSTSMEAPGAAAGMSGIYDSKDFLMGESIGWHMVGQTCICARIACIPLT